MPRGTPAGEVGEWWMCLTCGHERGPGRTEIDFETGLRLAHPKLVPVIPSEDLPDASREAVALHEAQIESFGPEYDSYLRSKLWH